MSKLEELLALVKTHQSIRKSIDKASTISEFNSLSNDLIKNGKELYTRAVSVVIEDGQFRDKARVSILTRPAQPKETEAKTPKTKSTKKAEK